MKSSLVVALGCAAFALALSTAPTPSTAQTMPAPTPVAVAHPDFSPMNFLVGTWTCTQPLRGKTRSETDVYAMSTDGMWLQDRATSPPFDQFRSVSQNSLASMTYDPTIKQWVTVYGDNFGGYGIESTSGWQGNAITWNGKGLDGSTVREVVTKVSDTETSDVITATDAQGKATTVTVTCKKG